MRSNSRKIMAALVASVAILTAGLPVQAAGVDPAATQILQRMSDYLANLQGFSVHTTNNIEDQLESGQRVDFDIAASVTIRRPNQLRAERKGELVNQVFHYDGATLTLYDPEANVYATEPSPATIEEMLDFVRDSLGLIIPAADLVYHNTYPLLMAGVTSAVLVGKSVIGGVRCDHLAFSRPGVDFQVWVADGDRPLPYKYVVTDTSTPALVSISTVMSQWSIEPAENKDSFTFTPPESASGTTFMRLGTGGNWRH